MLQSLMVPGCHVEGLRRESRSLVVLSVRRRRNGARWTSGGLGPIRRLTDTHHHRERERTGQASSRERGGGRKPTPFVNSAEQPGTNERTHVADRAVQGEHGAAACVVRASEQQDEDGEAEVVREPPAECQGDECHKAGCGRDHQPVDQRQRAQCHWEQAPRSQAVHHAVPEPGSHFQAD